MTMTIRTTRRWATLAVLLGAVVLRGMAAEAPASLRWRFGRARVYTYAYEFDQRSSAHSKLDLHPVAPEDEDTAAGGGRITVTGGEGQGTVILDHRVRTATALGRTMRSAELESLQMTANVVIHPDGTLVTNAAPTASNLESFIQTMFPIPVAPLAAAAPVRQPMKIVAPGVGDLEGEAVFTYQDQVRTNDLNCIRYQVACTLRTPPPAAGTEPPGQGEFTAQMQCLFAPAEGYFVSTDADALLRFSTRSKVEMRLQVYRKVRLTSVDPSR